MATKLAGFASKSGQIDTVLGGNIIFNWSVAILEKNQLS